MAVRDWQQRLNGFGYNLAVDDNAGPKTYSALFAYMGARDAAPALGQGADKHFPAYELVSPLRIAHWLAQFGHESTGFTRFTENMNYSAERLMKVWPTRFPNLAAAAPYAHNPEKLANKVYSKRMGNGPPESGDGWMFRGRGPQLTGRANYRDSASRTGLPLLEHPELAEDPRHFVHIACDFWGHHCCNQLADRDDIGSITKRINGGLTGLPERARLLARAKAVLV